MPEIERLYQCVVCPAAYDNPQSLRAHMKVHKGEYARTTIYVPVDLWPRFNEICKKHKTTTCHLLKSLIESVIRGEETGSVDLRRIGSPNPVIINVSHVFLGRPRSGLKVDVSDLAVDKNVCHVCGGHVTRERLVESTGFIEGSCFSCGSEWLIKKGS